MNLRTTNFKIEGRLHGVGPFLFCGVRVCGVLAGIGRVGGDKNDRMLAEDVTGMAEGEGGNGFGMKCALGAMQFKT